MANYRRPGPMCTEDDTVAWIDEGTMCLARSPQPGPVTPEQAEDPNQPGIKKSVGQGGVNNPEDVLVVHQLLNRVLPFEEQLSPAGKYAHHTANAIRRFQKNHMKLKKPDGKVDPGGKTFTALVDAAAKGKSPDEIAKAADLPASTEITLDVFKKHIAAAEGSYEHMYLDTTGNVTVGMGHLVSSVAAAQALKFKNKETGKDATGDEIKAAFEACKNNPGKTAPGYGKMKEVGKIVLSSADIDKFLDEHIEKFQGDLRKRYTKYDTYPDAVQYALLDMAFNLGMGVPGGKKGLAGWGDLNEAIAAEDWFAAGDASYRYQLAPARNATIKQWFRLGGIKAKSSQEKK